MMIFITFIPWLLFWSILLGAHHSELASVAGGAATLVLVLLTLKKGKKIKLLQIITIFFFAVLCILALLTDLVKKQMVMLGPGVAIANARKVAGLTVSEDGQVTAIAGDPQVALDQLAKEYMNLSGQIAQATLSSLLEKYPNLKSSK